MQDYWINIRELLTKLRILIFIERDVKQMQDLQEDQFYVIIYL